VTAREIPKVNHLVIGTSRAVVRVTGNPAGGIIMAQQDANWREICEAMVNESDPQKLSELAQQLVIALDEEKLRGRLNPRTLQAQTPKS
jgi:hypothetical protein